MPFPELEAQAAHTLLTAAVVIGGFASALLRLYTSRQTAALPAHPACGSSSGSFRHVAAHGNKDGALAGGL
jgi:hypothetical protein